MCACPVCKHFYLVHTHIWLTRSVIVNQLKSSLYPTMFTKLLSVKTLYCCVHETSQASYALLNEWYCEVPRFQPSKRSNNPVTIVSYCLIPPSDKLMDKNLDRSILCLHKKSANQTCTADKCTREINQQLRVSQCKYSTRGKRHAEYT